LVLIPVRRCRLSYMETASVAQLQIVQLQIVQPQIADDPVRVASAGGRSQAPLFFVSPDELPDEVPPVHARQHARRR